MTALDFTKRAPSYAPSLLNRMVTRIMRTLRLITYSTCGAVIVIIALSAIHSDVSQTAQYPAASSTQGGEKVSRLSTVIDLTGGFFGYGRTD